MASKQMIQKFILKNPSSKIVYGFLRPAETVSIDLQRTFRKAELFMSKFSSFYAINPLKSMVSPEAERNVGFALTAFLASSKYSVAIHPARLY
jgi:hypothetical protein